MILWRKFTINRLRKDDTISLKYSRKMIWRKLDHNNTSLWEKGLQKIEETQSELIEVLQQQKDDLLFEIVSGRKYNYRQLLFGIIHHDIYHVGQIVYINKMLTQAL